MHLSRVTQLCAAMALVITSSVVAAIDAPAATPTPCGTASTPPAWQHVIWIVFENKSATQITSRSAPYFNQLKAQCGYESNSYGVTHPSLPNYLALTGGSTFGITDDNPPASHPISAPSIFSELSDAGMTWKSYEESMSSNCQLTAAGRYAPKHNPAAYYTGLQTQCAADDVPLGTTTGGALRSDLASNALPNFSFVTPNLCNDMHDCSLATGNRWLATWLPIITNSQPYAAGTTAVFITFDEDNGKTGNHVYTVAVAPSIAAGTTVSTTADQYAVLRTTLEMLGLPTDLGAAATAPSLRAGFNL